MGKASEDVKEKVKVYRKHKGSAKPAIVFGN